MRITTFIFCTALFVAASSAQAFWGALGKVASSAGKGAGTAASGAAKVGGAAKLGGAAVVGAEASEAINVMRVAGGKSIGFADEALGLGTKSGLSIEEISKASGIKLGVPDEVAFYLKQTPAQLNEVQASRMFDLFKESQAAQASAKLSKTAIAYQPIQVPYAEAFHLLHLAAKVGHRPAVQYLEEDCRLQRLNWGHHPAHKHKPPRDRLHELEKIDAQCTLIS